MRSRRWKPFNANVLYVKKLSNEETFEANDADKIKEVKETICHAASLLDKIHGYWQDQENVQLLTKLTGFDGCEIRMIVSKLQIIVLFIRQSV